MLAHSSKADHGAKGMGVRSAAGLLALTLEAGRQAGHIGPQVARVHGGQPLMRVADEALGRDA